MQEDSMIGAKFYPRALLALGLLAGAWGFSGLAWWVGRQAGDVGVVRLVAVVLQGLGLVAGMIFVLPLLQRYLRRRPTLEVREEGLVVTLGVGGSQQLSWEAIEGVRAARLTGPLGLGSVRVLLRERHRSLGREVFVPQLFLDKGVDEVAAAIEPMIPGHGKRGGERRPRGR